MKLKWFIFLALFLIGLLIYYVHYGTPWGVKEYKHKVLTYLEKKYHQEFIIDQVDFDFIHKRYTSSAYAKNHPDQKFYINPGPQGTEFWDSYYANIDVRQMRKDWAPVVKRLYPDRINYSIDMIDYKDGEVPNKDTVIGIVVSLGQNITNDNKEQEFKRAFEFLMQLRKKALTTVIFIYFTKIGCCRYTRRTRSFNIAIWINC